MSDACHCCESPGDLWNPVECECWCHEWTSDDSEDDDWEQFRGRW